MFSGSPGGRQKYLMKLYMSEKIKTTKTTFGTFQEVIINCPALHFLEINPALTKKFFV